MVTPINKLDITAPINAKHIIHFGTDGSFDLS